MLQTRCNFVLLIWTHRFESGPFYPIVQSRFTFSFNSAAKAIPAAATPTPSTKRGVTVCLSCMGSRARAVDAGRGVAEFRATKRSIRPKAVVKKGNVYIEDSVM